MSLFRTVRVRTALMGLATGLLAIGAVAAPASAASVSKTIPFTLFTDKDETIVVPCPPGTPANIVLCGYVKDIPMVASNTAGDAGLSGAVTESFVSALEAPAPTPTCAAAMTPHTVGTIKTSKGEIYWVTAGGSFCTITGTDVEPFTIVGGTGAYKGASGGGVVNAQQISATGAIETFTGTLVLPN
jgi:hypothetical protein